MQVLNRECGTNFRPCRLVSSVVYFDQRTHACAKASFWGLFRTNFTSHFCKLFLFTNEEKSLLVSDLEWLPRAGWLSFFFVSLSCAWWKRFFVVFDHAKAFSSMHSLVEIHNTPPHVSFIKIKSWWNPRPPQFTQVCKPTGPRCRALGVVYFDQQTGALHAVAGRNQFFDAKITFCVF